MTIVSISNLGTFDVIISYTFVCISTYSVVPGWYVYLVKTQIQSKDTILAATPVHEYTTAYES